MSEAKATEMQQVNIYSQLQIQNKLIEPENNVVSLINRNHQLGNIDKRDYFRMCAMLERQIIYAKSNSSLYHREAGLINEQVQFQLGLSGSVNAKVRDALNTQTQIQKQSMENKGGFLSGVFRRSE